MQTLLRLSLPPYPCPRPRAGVKGVFNDPKYSAWKREAIKQLSLEWQNTPLDSVTKLSAQFYGWNRRGDLSNLFKAIEDAIVQAGVLRDDNLTVIQHIETAWEKADSKESQHIDVLLEYER